LHAHGRWCSPMHAFGQATSYVVGNAEKQELGTLRVRSRRSSVWLARRNCRGNATSRIHRSCPAPLDVVANVNASSLQQRGVIGSDRPHDDLGAVSKVQELSFTGTHDRSSTQAVSCGCPSRCDVSVSNRSGRTISPGGETCFSCFRQWAPPCPSTAASRRVGM